MPPFLQALSRAFHSRHLVTHIVIGITIGIFVGILLPEMAHSLAILGSLFVNALKAVAPILVFMLILAAIANHQPGEKSYIRPILQLYALGTCTAAFTAVMVSFLFPVDLLLVTEVSSDNRAPEDLRQVLSTLVLKAVDNPIHALLEANYLGLLIWAIGLGLALRSSADSTKRTLADIAQGISVMVKWVIRLAPLGIMGLVAATIAQAGLGALLGYAQLLLLLIGCMLLMALVINPAIVYWKLGANPYPLVLQCLRDSGVTAFFTRSSAANIPVNMALAQKMGLHEDTYSVSIPLGANINMSGAAITITVLTLAAVHTLGIDVSFTSALLLSLVAAVSACGASGVAGGSLLLIPLACSLFGIDQEVAMQVVAVGFIIGVLQDSAETALNSSTDLLFTAAACLAEGNPEKALSR